jgi:hypothetical protein
LGGTTVKERSISTFNADAERSGQQETQRQYLVAGIAR